MPRRQVRTAWPGRASSVRSRAKDSAETISESEMEVELISPPPGDARADAGTELGSPVEIVEVENALVVSGIGRLPEKSAARGIT
jgi:hypothetical protein